MNKCKISILLVVIFSATGSELFLKYVCVHRFGTPGVSFFQSDDVCDTSTIA